MNPNIHTMNLKYICCENNFNRIFLLFFSEGDNDSGVDETTQGNVSRIKSKSIIAKIKLCFCTFSFCFL